MRTALRSVAALLVAGVALLPKAASADEISVCVKASEQGQQLRDEGKYKRAREQFAACTRDACPAIVRKDCTEWLTQLDQSMPSVVIGARNAAGRDLVDVKVTIDGQAFLEKLDGKPVTLDPGEHAIHYETAGAAAVDERVVIHAGEKNRALSVQLGPAATPPPPPASAPPASATGAPAPSSSRLSPPVIVLGAVGAVALGSFAFFGVTGKGDVSDLRGSCAPNCEPSKVDAARTKLIVADISLAVGIVALGAATYLFLSGSKARARGTTGGATFTHVDVRPVAGGGVAELGARF